MQSTDKPVFRKHQMAYVKRGIYTRKTINDNNALLSYLIGLSVFNMCYVCYVCTAVKITLRFKVIYYNIRKVFSTYYI